jgi:hypothetical protein
MKKPLTSENLYACIIQNIVSNTRVQIHKLPNSQVDNYIEGVVSATTGIYLDMLRNNGVIENFTVSWSRTNEVVDSLVIQIQKTMAFNYTVYQYAREKFSREIMEVAEIMMI